MGRYDRLQVIWADAGYGGKLVGWAQATAGWSLGLVRRPAQQPTFQVLSRRWVVERTLGWLNLQRWLRKDYEALCETTKTRLYVHRHDGTDATQTGPHFAFLDTLSVLLFRWRPWRCA